MIYSLNSKFNSMGIGKLAGLFFISLNMLGCTPTKRLYRNGDSSRISSQQLNDTTFDDLKKYLTSITNAELKDTIIIKYDYNNETCWDELDKRDDDNVKSFIIWNEERVKSLLMLRKNVSIFAFREPGDKFNKIKKWDKSIIIDSNRYLFNLLFKERSTCGNSIIVLPDGRYVFIRSDSHSEAMEYSQEKIIEFLTK